MNPDDPNGGVPSLYSDFLWDRSVAWELSVSPASTRTAGLAAYYDVYSGGRIRVYFGGATRESMVMTGWEINGGGIATASGFGIGNAATDFPALLPTIRWGSDDCNFAYGTLNGLGVELLYDATPNDTPVRDGTTAPFDLSESPIDPSSLVVASIRSGTIGEGEGPYCFSPPGLPATS